MAINIFEGARRVVKLVGVLWIVGVVAENADEIAPLFERKLDLGDKIVLAYTVSFLGQAPIRIGAEYIPTEGITTEQALKMLDDKSIAEPICDSFHVRTRKGTEATVGLCYREQKARPITGMAVNKAPAELRHETVGNLAIKNARNSFVLSPQDEAWIDSQLWTARWELIHCATAFPKMKSSRSA